MTVAPADIKAGLTFEPEDHVYRLDGVVIPSVTQVLDAAGFVDATWFTPEATQRGTDVHEITAIYDRQIDKEKAECAIEKVYPEAIGYLRAWQSFLAESKATVLDIEQRSYNGVNRYAGTIDRRLSIRGVQTAVDIKTGQPEPWHALQLAAYAKCEPYSRGRYTVYLRKDATFRVKTHTDTSDWDVFLAALACFNWKKNHGVAV